MLMMLSFSQNLIFGCLCGRGLALSQAEYDASSPIFTASLYLITLHTGRLLWSLVSIHLILTNKQNALSLTSFAFSHNTTGVNKQIKTPN